MVISMTAGTVFLVWLGELITENGIGNGVSIIIFVGIVSRLPQLVGQSLFGGGNIAAAPVFAILGVLTVAAIVGVQGAEARRAIRYAEPIGATRMFGGDATHTQ